MRKRALTLILALALLFALALPAHAAGEPEIFWFEGEYGTEIIDGPYGEGMTDPWDEADPDALNIMEIYNLVFNASNNTVTVISVEEGITSPEFDYFDSNGDGPYCVSKTDENYKTAYGYADENGNIVIPMTYDYAHPFYNGTAVVEKRDETDNGTHTTYYLIDTTGKVLKTLDYDSVSSYMNGYYPVGKKPRTAPPSTA